MVMCAVSPSAHAADQAAAAAQIAQATQTAQSDALTLAAEEVVVTGSQIVRSGYEAPTPVVQLSTQDIQTDAPTNVADYLTKLPAFANSSTARNSANSVSGGNGGQSSLNLNGLGANRTLVLLDGMRIAPSSSGSGGGSVDTNGLPDALISRIDVVAGGASAAYGSDALAGVVNFVLNKDFTGLKGNLEGGVTSAGDDYQFLAELSGGTGFAGGRGHFLASATLEHVDGIPHGSSREWIAQGWDQITNPAYTATNGQPFYLVAKNVGSGLYTQGGLITSGPLKGIDFGPGGSTRMFNYGAVSPGGATMVGGDWQESIGSLNDAAEGYTISLDDRSWRENIFTRASYDVTDDINVFAQVMYSNSLTDSNAYNSTQLFTINSGNPFIPANVQSQMTAQNVSSFTLGKWTELPPINVHNTRQLEMYVIGAEGKFDAFGKTWSWSAVANRSKTIQAIRDYNMPNVKFLANAANVVRSPTTGQPICASTLTNPTDGCLPYNPMGTGVNSPATLAYALAGVSRLNQHIGQNELSATLRGEPVSTWAGPVSLSTGIEYRTQNIAGYSSPADLANAYFAANFHPTNGSYSVTEGFVETVVPLAKDASWAKELDLNAAVRETGYSTSGLVTTWKVGLTYDTPLDGLRFRATRSVDIRAPNLGELFSTGSSSQNSYQDPAKGHQTVTNVLAITTGNPRLTPETATNTGVGIVYQPDWAPGLSASVDYFYTKITDAIASVTAQNELDQCGAGVQSYCDLIQRDENGNLHLIYISPANTAYLKTSGVGTEVSYGKRLSEISDALDGMLSAHLNVAYTGDLTSTSPIGFTTQMAGVNNSSGLPKWRYNLNLVYSLGNYTVSWTGRGSSSGVISNLYTECTSACPTLTSPYFTINNNHLPSAFYMDASFAYHLETASFNQMDLYVNVENIANNTPDTFVNITAGNGVYDKLGTVIRTGVRFDM